MKFASIARVAFLILVAFSLMANPMKGAAQAASGQADAASAPAHSHDATTRAENKIAREEGKPTGEGDDIFRHSPMVQTLADKLHMDVESAARLFEIINFLIIVLGIGIPLFRIMPKVLRKRREALTKSIEEARAVTVDAQARLSAVESKLSNLSAEIHSFRSQVEQESAGDEARIKASVIEERERIVAAASQEIQQATAQAQRTLRQFAADLAMEQAVKQLKLNETTDKALIDDFIKDVTAQTTGSMNGGKH